MPNRVAFNANLPDISRSNAFYARSAGLIPAHSQTLAKGPTQYVNGVAPKYLRRGIGAHVWDVDGNEYIDFNMGVGPISLGYAYPRVDAAIKNQLTDGITFSLVHPLEVVVAEQLQEILPNAEMIRFAKTGAEATSAAMRAARAYTGRSHILCCGYHGWHDWYIGVLPRNAGVPQQVVDLVHTFDYNDLDSVAAALDDDTAAVILEPMAFDFPEEHFLEELQALCRANGTLLIYDEMWTGFRLALGGAQEYFGVEPDLACYSKAVANGMPLAVIAGRAEIMALFDEEIFFFSTFGGEALSLAAARATLSEMSEKDVFRHLAHYGSALQDGYNQIAAENGLAEITRCKGHPARSLVTFEPAGGDPLLQKSFVQQELIRRGVLWSGFHVISYSHDAADVTHTLDVYAEVLPQLRDAIEEGDLVARLRGVPVQPVFRKTGDFNTRPKANGAPSVVPVRESA
jgi:glutamate-1-semialdehyde aminotransferase